MVVGVVSGVGDVVVVVVVVVSSWWLVGGL